VPHAKFSPPFMQVLPWQQPGQLVGSQKFDWLQKPPPGPPSGMHCSLGALHGEHCCPCEPHADPSVPRRQTLPWQHPLQFDGLHVCDAQTPPGNVGEHVPPAPTQFWHWLPWLPHAVESVPVWQVSPRQQPGQFCGPHEAIAQLRVLPSQVRPLCAQC
jgi:hypothetical protein